MKTSTHCNRVSQRHPALAASWQSTRSSNPTLHTALTLLLLIYLALLSHPTLAAEGDAQCVSRPGTSPACFKRGPTGALMEQGAAAPGNPNWVVLGGFMQGNPSCLSSASGKIDCFYRGGDNALWRRGITGTAWGGEQRLGGTLTSEPSCISAKPNQITCYYRGNKNALKNMWAIREGWSSEEDLGGTLVDAPKCRAIGSIERCEATGTDGRRWAKTWSVDRWLPWAPTQQLVANKVYQLVNTASGKAADVAAFSKDNGAKVHQWDSHSEANQRWRAISSANNTFNLQNIHSDKCLDVPAGSPNDGLQMAQWACHSGSNQKWDVVSTGGNSFLLVSSATGKCLAIDSNATANGVAVRQKNCNGATSQRWQIVDVTSNNPGGTPTTPPVTPPTPPSADNPNGWSNPAQWGGQVPANGRNQDVTVPGGKVIQLDTDIDVGGLTIHGTLRCAAKNLNIRARWIMVHGKFECGTPDRPFAHRLVITLTGNNQGEDVMGMGTKFLGTMGGGQLWLHGENRTSWVKLNKTAQAGQASLELDGAPNWRPGDKIIITSTSANPNETEMRTVSGINGRTLSLSTPLQFRHFGEQQSYANGKGIGWTADTRASVGLMSRNILIRGDESSRQTQFGGHLMAMSGSPAYVSGVELENLGQVARLGRYPFHWHMAGNVSGQYIKNSSIHDSFNRCVTVHGSHNALVQDNVCFNQIGHAMFLEDGVETGNTFDRNLVVNTLRPENGKAIIPSDLFMGVASKGPAAFWISNGDNTVTNNVVAGSQGSGYWYHTEDKPSGASAHMPEYANVSPMTSRFGKFENNTVHSSRMAFSSCTHEGGPVGYSPPNQAVYKNLTVFFGGDGAIWPCWGNQLFTEMKVLDTGFETFGNDGSGPAFVAPSEVKVSRSLFVSNSKLVTTPKHRAALGLYDFGVDFTDTHFVNYGSAHADSVVAASLGGTNHRTDTTFSRVTFENSNRFLKLIPVKLDGRDHIGPNQWGSVIHDLDGSMGMGPGSMVANHPMALDPQCRPETFGDARFCPRLGWGMFHIFFGRYDITLPGTHHGRSDLGTRFYDRPDGMPWYQAQVSLSHNRYHYIFDMAPATPLSRELELQIFHAPKSGETLTLELTNMPGQAWVDHGEYRQVGSVAELKSSAGKTWAKVGNSVFVKMLTRGDTWQAHEFVKVRW